MEKDNKKIKPSANLADKNIMKGEKHKDKNFPGYPHYPPSEDIFNKEKEVDIDIESITKVEPKKVKLEKKSQDDLSEPWSEEDADGSGL